MTVIKYLFQPFLLTYTFSLEDTVQRLCTVCLRTVTSLRYKLVWVFFPFRELGNLVFDSGINTVRVQICRHTEQQRLLGDRAHATVLAQEPGAVAASAASPRVREAAARCCNSLVQHVRDALGLHKGTTDATVWMHILQRTAT